ncbi:uncharacterized protein LOC107398154 [Tribolium castaneum]|uniref:Uncharacterized protein n=1 Tax=Tribolium castaneum TaxID=7070 RepID=D6W7K8_TRICA|nr:PREDICTED: uncharacterized protein LOC107398154 [Tribolium castaneum]EFA11265.1 hypothetical protein TcasGA2_TC010800 [Tribolium castaneum]|eukprot:XP_015836721.1 PREDICTED: uncharacterized protein LOC107398154 [Tribolium castaneum]
MSEKDLNLNDGFVPSVWTCEEDIEKDIIAFSYFEDDGSTERPAMPDTLKEYYANLRSEKESKYNTESEKDVDESIQKESRSTPSRESPTPVYNAGGAYKEQPESSWSSPDETPTPDPSEPPANPRPPAARKYCKVDFKPAGYIFR